MTKNSSFVSWSLKQSRELSVKVWLLTFLTDAKFSTTSLQGFAVSDLYIYFSAQRVSASRWRPGYATGRRGLAPGGALHQFCTTPALAVRSTANTIAGMKLVVEAAKSRERRRGGPRPVYQAAGVSLAPRHQKGPDEHNKRTFNEDKLALVGRNVGSNCLGCLWKHMWELHWRKFFRFSKSSYVRCAESLKLSLMFTKMLDCLVESKTDCDEPVCQEMINRTIGFFFGLMKESDWKKKDVFEFDATKRNFKLTLQKMRQHESREFMIGKNTHIKTKHLL